MMELILGNQILNAGCPDFGVKVGGDSEDQIREPSNDVSFQRFIIIHYSMKYQMIASVLDIRYLFVETQVSELGKSYLNFSSRNLGFGIWLVEMARIR
jgi:hypothetical protein